MQRRKFVVKSGRAALALGALPLAACSSRTPTARRDAFLESLVAGWEAGIPQWLKETKMPAVSVALIRDGQLAWRRAFGVKDTGTPKMLANPSGPPSKVETIWPDFAKRFFAA